MDEVIEFLKDMVKYIIIIAIIVLIRIYVLTTTDVIGSSMEPNLHDNNILLVDQITQKFNGYKRFDVIVFIKSPSYLIKRVIGLPGETIQYRDNLLYVNEKQVKEDFKTNGETKDFGPITVPKDKYYVLGDNRINSTDSRVFGAIDKDKIIGKSFFRIWPLNKLTIVN